MGAGGGGRQGTNQQACAVAPSPSPSPSPSLSPLATSCQTLPNTRRSSKSLGTRTCKGWAISGWMGEGGMWRRLCQERSPSSTAPSALTRTACYCLCPAQGTLGGPGAGGRVPVQRAEGGRCAGEDVSDRGRTAQRLRGSAGDALLGSTGSLSARTMSATSAQAHGWKNTVAPISPCDSSVQ